MKHFTLLLAASIIIGNLTSCLVRRPPEHLEQPRKEKHYEPEKHEKEKKKSKWNFFYRR